MLVPCSNLWISIYHFSWNKDNQVSKLTAQKMKFPLNISSAHMTKSAQFPVNLVRFTEQTCNGKLHFCAVLVG